MACGGHQCFDECAALEPPFRKYFAWSNVFEDYGYPFGHRVDLGKAAQSCALLGDGRA
jgi:hypothetical protein